METQTVRPTKDESITPVDPYPNLPNTAMATFRWAQHRGEKDAVYYPESDGKPMADNMGQARWMHFLFSNLERLYRDDPNVLVCTDLLWYPVKGDATTAVAPDVVVIFGRPKYERGSYTQFTEGNVAPQVVFEIISESNTKSEMLEKTEFYQKYGVREFYLYDYNTGGFEVVLFTDGVTRVVSVKTEWTSPLLGVRFVPQARADMEAYFPDGTPFLSYKDVFDLMQFQATQRIAERERANRERERADAETRRAEATAKRAAAEQDRADAAEAEVARLRSLLAANRSGTV